MNLPESVREKSTGKSRASPPPESDNAKVTATTEARHETVGQDHGLPPAEGHRQDEDGSRTEKEFTDAVGWEQSCLLPDFLDHGQLSFGPDKEDEDGKNEGSRGVAGDGDGGHVPAAANRVPPFDWEAATNELRWDDDLALAGARVGSDMGVFLDGGYGYWDNELGWI